MASKPPLKKIPALTARKKVDDHKPGKQGSAAMRSDAVAVWSRVLDEWREMGKLDVAAMRGLVEDFVITIPPDTTKAVTPDLRVSGRYAMAHGLNMLGYAIIVGKALGIGGPDLRNLGLAALLHDIGKNDEVPRIHPSREELIRHDEHCMTGYRLLKEYAPDLPDDVAEAVRDHHERLDGSGILQKAKVSEMAFVVGICDLYDARVTPHWFRGSCSPHEAYRIVVNQFQRFPKAIADAFALAVVPYPPGSPVFLMDGRKGEVVALNPENSTAPVVDIGGKKEDLQSSKCRIIDLVRDGAPV